MWMGKQLSAAARLRQEEHAQAEVGIATMSGSPAAVHSRGEERALPLFGPAGIAWMPRAGEQVLVIKGGCEQDESCVAGVELTNAPATMQPGELYLCSAGGASVYLKNDGRIELQGELYINGAPYSSGLTGGNNGALAE